MPTPTRRRSRAHGSRSALTDLDAATTLLRGTYVDTAPVSGVSGCTLPYTPGQASSATRDYNFTRSQDAFEETVAYAAITRVQRSYVAYGFPGIFAAPMKIDNHCISDDNSFYSTADNAMHMGDGGVDDAEDADVTVHEFGHATQANQLPGFGPGSDTEQRAMGEGFGDFLAAFTYLQDGNAAYQAGRRFCVAEWDATSYNPVTVRVPDRGCLRWVNGKNEGTGGDIGTYPGTPDEEHNDGRYWSAMLTCVFNGIEPSLGTAQARDRMVTLVLAHHFDLTPTAANTAFADSLAALRAEDNALFEGDEIGFINQCGLQRLGKNPPVDTTAPVVNGAFTPAAPDGNNGWYRTVPTVNWSTTDEESGTVDTGCTDGPVAANVGATTLTCTATSSGGVTAKSLAYKHDNVAPALAATLSAAPRVGDAVTATPNATDAVSGVAAQSCGVPDTSTTGPHTVACTASDAAGNGATQTLSYTVASQVRAADDPDDLQDHQGQGGRQRQPVVPHQGQPLRPRPAQRQGRQGQVQVGQQAPDRRQDPQGHAQALQEGPREVPGEAERRQEGEGQAHDHADHGEEEDGHADRAPPLGGAPRAHARDHAVRSASVGDRRAARRAGSSPAIAPIPSAAPSPPAQPSAGMTIAQPCVVA